jgi:hypothetical protein
VWKSASELGYAEIFVNLNAIEQMQLRRQHRVDGVGRPKFDFHTGLDYAPFTPEPVRMKAEVANQLKIALVQASGLTEGSPLVVFEVSSSDKILHRWRSQERKKTPHPVWHQQLAVWKSNFGRPTPLTRRASVAASARWRGGSTPSTQCRPRDRVGSMAWRLTK